MTEVLVRFIVIVLIIAFAAMAVFVRMRKLRRDAKNYERGLSMVHLKIHLPPVSDDVVTDSRDSRDVVDENISKAQSLYNILASTAQKDDFKTKYYGQSHIGFEIIANKGFVHFYATAPSSLVPVAKQAIVSAYPTARVEESTEHNFFDDSSGSAGIAGGELVLKNDFAYPIATYMDSKKDVMQTLLNALSSLESTDNAGLQILVRPAQSDWVKMAKAEAEAKRKGESKKSIGKAALGFTKDIIVAPIKPPDSGQDKAGGPPKEISGLDQALIEAIEAKVQHPGFEVLIRFMVASDSSEKSEAIYNNLTASFALFDAAGQNGFKKVDAKKIEEMTTAFNLRLFPVERNRDILNTIELASLFHIPDQSHIPTTQLERQMSKQVDGPRDIPKEGLLLGENVFRGNHKNILLSDEDRMRHMYIVGQTGTGKSVLLENLAEQDMMSGKGFAFVDPHGDTAEELLSRVPKHRAEDIIYCNPTNLDFPMGLNIFEHDNEDQQDFLIQEAMNMLYKLYDPTNQGIIGPRYEYMFRNAAKLIMADPQGGTFIDIPKLFNDPHYVKEKLQHVKDQSVIDFWTKELPSTERSEEAGNIKSWFVSKFSAFLGNTMMRNMIGQTESSFNIREIMDQGKILIVNLSKGKTGELNMKLLGMLFVTKFQMAAMSRDDIPKSQRRDFTLYVDEFQNFATDSFASILSEARKYRLGLVVANQFTTQLTEEIRDAVYGNVGTSVSFRVGAADAEDMVQQFFSPVFDVDDLTRLPAGQAYVRMLIKGVPTQPFSMSTFFSPSEGNHELGKAIEKLSSTKYGRPRDEVEKAIMSRLDTTPEVAQAQAAIAPPITPPIAPRRPIPPPPPSGTGRSPTAHHSPFLMNWLHKKRRQHQPSPKPPQRVGPPPQKPPISKPTASHQPTPPPVAPPKQKETVISLREDGHHSQSPQDIPHVDSD